MKLAVLGATLLSDDLFNIGKENVARGVNTPKKNSKWYYSIYQGNISKNLFLFLESGRNFHSFFKKNVNLQLLELEHASPNKKFNIITDGCCSTSEIYLQFNTQWFKSSVPVLEMFVLPNAVKTFSVSIITHLK